VWRASHQGEGEGHEVAGWHERARRAALRALVALAVLVMGLGTGHPATAAPPPGRVANAPVVFVHGFLLNLCPQTDTASVFASAVTTLRARGYTGPTEAVAYYACDHGGPSIQKSGDPNAYFPSGAYSDGGNTDNTDIRHISYQLAWYLYDTYSSKGKTVELVAHSMGGLITRWMLYQVQAGNPLFPPYLYVQDSITISTPHNGIQDGTNNLTWCAGTLQCTQMTVGSTFLTELRSYGMNPQGTGGTQWTAMGSRSCDIMTAEQSTDMGDAHKVVYTGSSAPGCYNHTSYLTDTSTATDQPVQFWNPGDTAPTTATTGAHSLAWVANALMGIHPTSTGPGGGPGTTPPAQDVNKTVADVQKSLAGIKL
jgi:hypothetical protein